MAIFEDAGGSGPKSFVMSKLGPMPVWAWMLVGLGGAVAYASYRNNKAAKAGAAEGTTTDEAVNGIRLIGGDQTPPLVFQNYSTTLNTFPGAPPGAGRMFPPVHVPPPGHGQRPTPDPTPPPPAQTSPPAPTPAPAPAPAAPSGTWVTVAKWTASNTPWNSTLWGIAKQFGRGSGSTNYLPIWNDPNNAALKQRRGDPKKIQPGDRIWVPA